MKFFILILTAYTCAHAESFLERWDSRKNNTVSVVNSDSSRGGTGFYVRAGGKTLVVTNAHVCKTSSYMLVTNEDGRTYPAKVIKTDKNIDLCALEGEEHSYFYVAWFSPECPSEYVYTQGHPNLKPLVFTTTTVCDRVVFFHPIPGDSGSPVLNGKNELVGVIRAYDNDRKDIGYMVSLTDLKLFLGSL